MRTGMIWYSGARQGPASETTGSLQVPRAIGFICAPLASPAGGKEKLSVPCLRLNAGMGV